MKNFIMEFKGLRIGNLLQIKTSKSIFVTEIKSLYVAKDECLINNESLIIYEPIPLTLEWIINFDFKAMEISEYTYDSYSKGGIQIWHRDKTKLVIEKPSVSYPLQYVHQLQNLYFALTGEELQVNL